MDYKKQARTFGNRKEIIMKDFTLNFLGSDSGFGEKNNSAYVELGNDLWLIDCGYTVFNELRSTLNLEKYESINVIITHLHNDHAGSLCQLILYSFFVLKKKVNVYSKCERIKEYLDITGVVDEAYSLFRGSSNLKFIKTEHAKQLDAYGFLMNCNGKKIVYTSDTATLEPFVEYINSAEELYVDMSIAGGVHLKIEDCMEDLKALKQNGVKVVLMHIDNREKMKELVKDEFYFA